MDGKKVALGREDLVFLPGHPWAYPRPTGRSRCKEFAFFGFVASRPGLHRQLVKSGLRRGARIGGYVFETVTTIVRSAMDLSA
jgi:hypothetical protein